MFRSGTIVCNRFQIMDVVGQGGLGIVYVAQDSLLHRPVALKFLRDEHVNNAELKERFFHEVIHSSQLYHQNIVTVHDFCHYQDQPFIVMEYLDGPTLEELIVKQAPFPLKLFKTLCAQMLDAIALSHKIGLFHGDIKPLNMKVQGLDTGTPQIKLYDFGLSRILHRDLRQVISEDGTTEGSPMYMAPEQFLARNIDGRTDLYAIGVVLYQLLSARAPHDATSVEDWIDKILHEAPISLRDRNPNIPLRLESIIMRLLSKRPDQRHDNAKAVLADLGL